MTARKSRLSSKSILPEPKILMGYEKLSKGAAQTILDIIRSEQEHRQRWENNYLKTLSHNYRMGQLLIFALAVIIVYVSIAFVMVQDRAVAIVVVLAGFGFLSLVAIINTSPKNLLKRYKAYNAKSNK